MWALTMTLLRTEGQTLVHVAWVGFLDELQVSSVALDKTLNLLEPIFSQVNQT